MGLPIQPLRIVLGLLSLFFAYSLGRFGTRLYLTHQPFTRAIAWVLRTVVCLAALLWSGGLDLISIVFLALAAISFAGGAWLELRPHHVEEIHILPPEK